MNQKGLLALVIILIVLVLFILLGLFFYLRSNQYSFIENIIPNWQLVNKSVTLERSQPFKVDMPLPIDPKVVEPTPSVMPELQCQKDEECTINYRTCTATTKTSLRSNASNNSCSGIVRCMYGACALTTK
jgi:hypothetical protein